VTSAFFTTFFKQFRRIRMTLPELVFDEMERKPQNEENGHNLSITNTEQFTGSSRPS